MIEKFRDFVMGHDGLVSALGFFLIAIIGLSFPAVLEFLFRQIDFTAIGAAWHRYNGFGIMLALAFWGILISGSVFTILKSFETGLLEGFAAILIVAFIAVFIKSFIAPDLLREINLFGMVLLGAIILGIVTIGVKSYEEGCLAFVLSTFFLIGVLGFCGYSGLLMQFLIWVLL